MTHGHKQRTITMSLRRGLSIIAVAVLTSIVTTTISVISIANSDHFTLIALAGRLDTVQKVTDSRTENYNKIPVILSEIQNLNTTLTDIKNSEIRIEGKIDSHISSRKD